MIVVVEGIDRAGKTTFCEALSKATGWPVYKHNCDAFDYADMDDANEADKMIQLLDLIDQLDPLLANGSGVIFDRFHLSNLIYGVADRGYDAATGIARVEAIEERLLEMRQGAVLVMLYDDCGTLRASLQHGSDLSVHQECFDVFYSASRLPKLKGTFNDVNDLVNVICSAAEME